jgi:hypothetical protein
MVFEVLTGEKIFDELILGDSIVCSRKVKESNSLILVDNQGLVWQVGVKDTNLI